jgi:hypothetical protein
MADQRVVVDDTDMERGAAAGLQPDPVAPARTVVQEHRLPRFQVAHRGSLRFSR